MVLAAKGESDERLAEEAADLLFHLLVALDQRGVPLASSARRAAAPARERHGDEGARRSTTTSGSPTGGGRVPVFRELPGRPAHAGLRLPRARRRASERAFLLESVVGGERLARYSFLGRDPSPRSRRAAASVVVQRRGGRARESAGGPAGRAARARWARRAAEVPGPAALHRRRRRLPHLRRGRGSSSACPTATRRGTAPLASFSLLPLARGLRPRAPAAGADRRRRARAPRRVRRARRRSSTRWRQDLRAGRPARPPRRGARRRRRRGRARRRRRVPRRRARAPRSTSPPATSSRSCSRASTTVACARRPVRRLPRPAHGEPVALHVLPQGRRDARSRAPRPRCWCASRAGGSRRGRSPARARAAPTAEEDERARPRSCSPTRRSAPST